MPIEPHTETLSFIAQVEHIYAGLMQFAAGRGETSLGGKLIFAGELDEAGRTLTVAGNIAGAATLTASANADVLRQALREAVIDFLVTSLDEALRILKNEIRKREPVAVGVSIAPEAIANEMLDRGVLPDLIPPRFPATPEFADFVAQGAQRIESKPLPQTRRLLAWSIPFEYAQHPADFDAILLEQLPQHETALRRWVQLSPRYLGPHARRLRSITSDAETASKLIDILGPPHRR